MTDDERLDDPVMQELAKNYFEDLKRRDPEAYNRYRALSKGKADPEFLKQAQASIDEASEG